MMKTPSHAGQVILDFYPWVAAWIAEMGRDIEDVTDVAVGNGTERDSEQDALDSCYEHWKITDDMPATVVFTDASSYTKIFSRREVMQERKEKPMHPEEKEDTRPSDASPTQSVHPLSGHQIWIEGSTEGPPEGYLLKVHDMTTGEDILNCCKITMDLRAGAVNLAQLTLYPDDQSDRTEMVEVTDPYVSLSALVHSVRIEEEG